MKRSRFALCLTLVLILLLALAPTAFADTSVVGSDASASGTEDGSVFLAGQTAGSSAEVRGILFSAGSSVSAAGTYEYALLAGNDVNASGVCENDAFLAGRTVSVTGPVARDLYAAGQTVRVSGEVGRDFYAAGNSVVISGDIGGNVYLRADSIHIDDGVKIGGTLLYNSNAKIKAPQSALASVKTYDVETPETPVELEAPKGPTVTERIRDKVFVYVGLLLLGYALLWLTPLWESLDARYTGAPFGHYARAFGIGFAVLAGLPLAAILLMITGFGLRPAFVLLLMYAVVLLIAPLFISFFVGVLLWRTAFRQKANIWIELPLGLFVWRVLTLIPGVKFAVGLVSAPLALGVMTLLLRWKKAVKAQPPVEPPVEEPAAEAPAGEAVPELAVEEPSMETIVEEVPAETSAEETPAGVPLEEASLEPSVEETPVEAPVEEAPAEAPAADEQSEAAPPALPPEE